MSTLLFVPTWRSQSMLILMTQLFCTHSDYVHCSVVSAKYRTLQHITLSSPHCCFHALVFFCLRRKTKRLEELQQESEAMILKNMSPRERMRLRKQKKADEEAKRMRLVLHLHCIKCIQAISNLETRLFAITK